MDPTVKEENCARDVSWGGLKCCDLRVCQSSEAVRAGARGSVQAQVIKNSECKASASRTV
ncbi:Uncharacterized protein DAT39_005091 [Clarias magur]|uniref:Uncharacterized protein n=1 Tax=Clarias magur TaxID=1594786 RepID=A0A8J4X822_CLAMG|nr:Uncharacterized protein DAT39_005091 [Clarias magur]